MDALGGYFAQSPSSQLLRAAAFLGGLLLTAILERLQTELREEEVSTWWVSNGRDVINVFALAVCAFGLWVLGFRGPLVLCLAASVTVALSLVQAAIVKRKLPVPVSLLAAVAMGLPVALFPDWFATALHLLLEQLF